MICPKCKEHKFNRLDLIFLLRIGLFVVSNKVVQVKIKLYEGEEYEQTTRALLCPICKSIMKFEFSVKYVENVFGQYLDLECLRTEYYNSLNKIVNRKKLINAMENQGGTVLPLHFSQEGMTCWRTNYNK